MDSAELLDTELVARYDRAGPRYTSYPTAVQFDDDFDEAAYRRQAALSRERRRPLSLYVHIPFCDTVCFYCACNKIVTRNRRHADNYLERLHREIELQGSLFGGEAEVRQLHLGGGTPTFISLDRMASLMAAVGRQFPLLADDQGEYSIEIDPREVNREGIFRLRELGFNRMSIGVQDFDPRVQAAVNRIQPVASTEAALAAARQAGFRSISMDLIYGLPLQSAASFRRTLERVVALRPDRLSVFNYAHLPAMFKVQRQIDEAQLPSAAEKLDILRGSLDYLGAAGYDFIGMDHFALPDDELAVAQRNGTLYRNFQGYSTHSECDLIGLGLTAIGMVGDSYSQNHKTLEAYQDALDQGRLPVCRGIGLTAEDRLRRELITALICHFQVDLAELGEAHRVDWQRHFAGELRDLQTMEDDGLLRLEKSLIRVLPPGRWLIRNICMVFDAYLRQTAATRFSRVI
jgi:oxygen-independent coproporphyrinogen-3 oxidase